MGKCDEHGIFRSGRWSPCQNEGINLCFMGIKGGGGFSSIHLCDNCLKKAKDEWKKKGQKLLSYPAISRRPRSVRGYSRSTGVGTNIIQVKE